LDKKKQNKIELPPAIFQLWDKAEGKSRHILFGLSHKRYDVGPQAAELCKAIR